MRLGADTKFFVLVGIVAILIIAGALWYRYRLAPPKPVTTTPMAVEMTHDNKWAASRRSLLVSNARSDEVAATPQAVILLQSHTSVSSITT